MARYKETDIKDGQGLFLMVNLKEQLLPGTFEYMLDKLIGNKIDISIFDNNYNNDVTGAKSISPALLIKLIIYGYFKGMNSSRKISELCEKNIVAKALSEGLEPHWTTIAKFISSNSEIFKDTFVKVLLYCAELDLIGGETFAIDGCRLPSNASLELSGTRDELEKKLNVYRRMAEKHIAKHRRHDDKREQDKKEEQRYRIRQRHLNMQIAKLDAFLENMDIKEGRKGKEIKSNVTDNESATIRTSEGFIQGYIGLAIADKSNQIIVSAGAVGSAYEGDHFPMMLDKMLDNMKNIGMKIPEETKQVMLADSNYFSEDNLKTCYDKNIEAIMPDTQYRKRLAANEEKKQYEASDFKYHEEGNYYECPNGKKLEYKRNDILNGKEVRIYQANMKDCRVCQFSTRCIKSKKEISKINSGKKLVIRKTNEPGSLCNILREKLNSKEYQEQYAYRIQIIEPVFSNITYCKRLDRFTLRGKEKVSGQWLLYCMVHNLSKCLIKFNSNLCYT